MGFVVVGGTSLENWLAERRKKKKIRVYQKVIDDFKKTLETIAKKNCLEDAAIYSEAASKFGAFLRMKEGKENTANNLAILQLPLFDELSWFESRLEQEIEAL